MYGPFFRIVKINSDNCRVWWDSFYSTSKRLKHIPGDADSVDESTWKEMKALPGWNDSTPPLEFESFFLENPPKSKHDET